MATRPAHKGVSTATKPRRVIVRDPSPTAIEAREPTLAESVNRILITGGAGFLGSHLCERLLREGHDVLCVDNFYTSTRRNITHLLEHPNFELMRHDVTFPLYVEVDQIYNMACPASPIHYQRDPVQTTKTSVHGAINMLGLAKRTGARILQASTSEVYGDPQVHPQPESYWGNVNPIGSRSCYDEGKRCAETLFFDYRRQHKLPIKVARIFNTYGPRMLPDDGRVVSNFIVQALAGRNITIFGDGEQTRSFCYVDDLVEGLIRLMDSADDFTGPCNLGNPGEFTIRELAEMVVAMTGSDSQLVSEPLPEDGPHPTPAGYRPGAGTTGLEAYGVVTRRPGPHHRILPLHRWVALAPPMNKIILVTGGAGYIGSHACKQLAKAGYEPITYDNLDRGHRELVKWGPLEEGDILDQAFLTEVCKHYKPAAVMHFAALCYVGESMAKPDLYQRVNVEGSMSLLNAMTLAGVNKMIFSSTCATYGEPQEVPITEAHPQHPVNPYGETKLEMERAITQWAESSDSEAVLFRYFNAAGADPDTETGEWHQPETHLVPLALAAAAGDLDELTIHGNDYPTPDGTCVRDYIHVTDLADAHLLGLEYEEGKGTTSTFNLGNGNGFSVMEVVETVAVVTGREVPYTVGERRPGDPPRLVGDATLARDQLGWLPKLTALEEIIATGWKWYQTR